jgi:hypothetical protein
MGSTETWLHKVKVTIHTENDGYRVLRRGLESRDEEVTLEEAVRSFGGEYVRRELLHCVESAIRKVKDTGGPHCVRLGDQTTVA